MMVNGLLVESMVEVQNSFQMVINMWDNIGEVGQMAKAYTHGPTAANTKENSMRG